MDAASNDILADITEWSDGKRFIAPDAKDIGHINEALREVLKFEAALQSSQTPVEVSLLRKRSPNHSFELHSGSFSASDIFKNIPRTARGSTI